MKIDFDQVKNLANELAEMNGRPTDILAVSQKTYDENKDSFANGYWEDLKIEIIDNASSDNFWLYNKKIGMKSLKRDVN